MDKLARIKELVDRLDSAAKVYYSGKDEIMSILSPDGAVYQAGTLSGNPLAMTAGIATLSKIFATPNVYEKLGNKVKSILKCMSNSAKRKGIALQTEHRGTMWGFFFNENKVTNYDIALKSDTQMFAKFHAAMLKRGIYLAPSQFETLFMSGAHTDEEIDRTIEAAGVALKKVADYLAAR